MKNKKSLHIPILITSIAVIFSSVVIFMLGFHNFDMCQNFEDIECYVNSEFSKNGINTELYLLEQTITRQNIELDTCYIGGIRQIFIGFIFFGIGMYGLGYEIRNIEILLNR